MATPPDLVAMTCNNCGKKIAEVKMRDGVVSVICSKCGTINVVETKPKTTQSVPNAGR